MHDDPSPQPGPPEPRHHRRWPVILLYIIASAGLPAFDYFALWIIERLDEYDPFWEASIEMQVSLWLVLAPALWSAGAATIALWLRRRRERRAGASRTERWRILPVWGWALVSWLGGLAVYFGLENLRRLVEGQRGIGAWWPDEIQYAIQVPLIVCTLVGAGVGLLLLRRRRGFWPYIVGPAAACAVTYPLVWSAVNGDHLWRFWACFGAWGLCMYAPLFWWAGYSALRPAQGCPRCGYDLSGLNQRSACPECGYSPKAAPVDPQPRFHPEPSTN